MIRSDNPKGQRGPKIRILPIFAPLLLLLLFARNSNGENLLSNVPATSHNTEGSSEFITTEPLPPEGGPWNAPGILVLKDTDAELSFDLRENREIRALVLQGDNNDVYIVEGSVDGSSWELLWRATFVPALRGLRTRWGEISPPRSVRYLRVRGANGDSNMSISRLYAYSTLPSVWPPKLTNIGSLRPLADPSINQERMDIIKCSLGALGAMVLIFVWLTHSLGASERYRKIGDRLLLLVGVLSALSFWNLFQFHFYNYVHTWDFYHYYMGSKYSAELGYSRLYECSAVAEAESGADMRAHNRRIRNLLTNHIEYPTEILAHPERCKDHFAPQRWRDFVRDTSWFRDEIGPERWPDSQIDHGYNGTPVWGIMGHLLSNHGPVTRTEVEYLASLDTVLLLLMWLFVWRAFGWRAMCVGLIYFGTNYPARFWWNGGSFLRYDWLAYAVIGISLLKMKKNTAAGILLAYSTLLRIFPACILIGLALRAIFKMVSEKRIFLEKETLQIMLGALASCVILVPVSIFISKNTHVWEEFIQNSRKHLETPLTNNMGLKTVLSYNYDKRSEISVDTRDPDPYAEWKREQRETFSARAPIYYLFVGIFMLAAGWVARRQEIWVASIIGISLIPVMTELTCYYYSIFLALGFLSLKRPVLGIALSLVSWLSYVFSYYWTRYDDGFVWISLLYLGMTTLSILLLRNEELSEMDTR